MKPIIQEHSFGCSVACVAYILNTSYKLTLELFPNENERVAKEGFYCSEIVNVLRSAGLDYNYKYITSRVKNKIYSPNTIVFIKRSNKYPAGHFLCRVKNGWMDPWINFPNLSIRAGFRKRLPGKPIYTILKI